ncbi:nitroreductase family deazaflavin-dependent oxidoreductase [Tomitella biformata]|uniref:nitroreductase family deazaflavin-dependent oxidoreductase n=1 Tax=Tomitella biformata TaxID=630403 RepID=UPI000466AA18|nr:nitroreductase family deazaflavin-dependent oxidoreductase [Tomitella biformata]
MSAKKPPLVVSALVPRMLRMVSQANVQLFQATGGRLGGKIGGRELCLLTTTGRKSGLERTLPLLFMRDGEDVVLVGAQGGLPQHPAWYWNIRANPRVHVRTAGRTVEMIARIAGDEERTALWPRLIATYPGWAKYQSWTDRVIPVIVCEPA